jgi:TniQ
MSDKTPVAYEGWDLTPPELPQRCRLYPLEPIGVGTPLVESLTGYLARLAEAHCVSTGTLYSKEIDALTRKGNIFSFRIEGNAGYSTHTINGRGTPAMDFVRALESLTHRRDLRYLTLLPWAEVLPVQGGIQRRVRAWCPQCLSSWRTESKPLYEPLLWTLKPVTLCAVHRQPMCFLCPFCKRQNGNLDARIRPGYCSRCGGWLAQATSDVLSNSGALTNDDLSWGDWVATVLGEVLAAALQSPFTPTREGVSRIISLCVERIGNGNASAFARLMDAGRGDVRRWQTGKAQPKFSVLLILSYRLAISLLNLLSGTVASVPREFVNPFPSQLSKRQSISKKPRRSSRRMQPVTVMQTLQAALNESPPPSVRRVIQRTNHDKPMIYRHFPEICRAIARRFADYRKVQAVIRRDRARAEVRDAAIQLHARGVSITRNHLRPLLTSSDYTNLEEGRAALRLVREELRSRADTPVKEA